MRARNPILKDWEEVLLFTDVVVIYGVIVAKFVFFFIAYKPFETGLIIKLSRVLVIKSVSGAKVIDV